MDLKLKGRRALVTGSSSGIGEAIARMLAQDGANVVVHGRNRERAEKVAAEIKAAGVAIGDLATDEGAAAVHDTGAGRARWEHRNPGQQCGRQFDGQYVKATA